MTTTFAWPRIFPVMSIAFDGHCIDPTGVPLAQTENVTPFTSLPVLAKYLDPGVLLNACCGGAVELAASSDVLDGSGVTPAVVRVLKWHPDSHSAKPATASERKSTVPCMSGSFHAQHGAKLVGPVGFEPTRNQL